jgi:acetyl-CoA carboxylase carboxyl transferase subunit beta
MSSTADWFRRIKQGIITPTKEKKETPEGLWYKCPKCKHVAATDDHHKNLNICEGCDHHDRLSAEAYFDLFFDEGSCTEFNANMVSADPLGFVDTKNYDDRIKNTIQKSGLNDAVKTAYGDIHGQKAVVAAMDFAFIGGSMGSVVGEKIARGIDKAIELKCGFIMVSKSGGARMMEAGFSLMQMAKTSAKLTLLAKSGLPYISYLTDPTTGGVTASFAMLGDINIAEPKALIGFAGPRVIKETIKKDLPKGFQSSEFLLEAGFLDYIVNRREAKNKLAQSLKLFYN